MMMKNKIVLLCLGALMMVMSAKAEQQDSDTGWFVKGRLGYNIGGTAPLGMPASIRSLDAFHLSANFMEGLDVGYEFTRKIGVQAGLHLERKDMDGEVTVKGYKMKVKMDADEMEGYFTGHVRQQVDMWMITLPVQFTFNASRKLTLKAGPYVSWLFEKNFSGYAYDGYLRKDDPTGPMVKMGTTKDEWATYDFPDDMRRWQFGVGVGLDWDIYRGFGVSADLNWGLTGLMKSSFKTVDQVLYPIYGTIGIFCKLK